MVSKIANSRFFPDIKNKILPGSKRSQGHVEVILATVLFVGFLVFVFAFLNSSFRTNPDILITNTQEKLLERISSDVGKLSAVVDTINDCYSLDKVNETYGDNFVEINDSNNLRRYTIYYGDFFDSNVVGKISCLDRENRNFFLGVYIEEGIIVDQKIKDLKTAYADYADLKQSLGVDDFSFEFKNLDGSVITELSVDGKIPENVDVVSKDFPVRVMNDRAEIRELILNIRVWR